MSGLKQLVAAAGIMTVAAAGILSPVSVQAAGVFQGCTSNPDAAVCQASSTDTSQQAQSMVGTVINIILFIVGIIAVIMIIIGGIRYVLSNGDASGIQSAKNTILYAVIGLVIAMLAFAIVNFLVAQFK